MKPQTGNRTIFVFGGLLLSAASLLAGTANVGVWVRDASTGKAVKNAYVVVLQDADTVANPVLSKTSEPSEFRLDVPASSVETDPLAAETPASFGTVEACPNPCSDSVTLNLPPAGSAGTAVMNVFNVLGRQIFSGPVRTPADAGLAVDLRLQNLASGIYLVRAVGPHRKTASGKFLKIGGSLASASPSVRISGVRPFDWKRGGLRNAASKAAEGTLYTFTAYTFKNSVDAFGAHAAGWASATVPVSKDTTIELNLEKVPFSEGGHNLAPRSEVPVAVDGVADDPVWSQAAWGPINQLWLGVLPEPDDFTGRYKIAWDSERLYVLAEIRDDSLSDQYPNPLQNYYMDDCLEMFLDENASGGNHQYSYNAFAYHVSTKGNAVDVGPGGKAMDFTDHVKSKWTRNGDVYTWELAIKVFDDSYDDGRTDNAPVTLSAGKTMGFMVAYCDNDGTFDRESFIGSIFIPGADKNVGWINASVFGTLELLP